jgi:hypothetical protein
MGHGYRNSQEKTLATSYPLTDLPAAILPLFAWR